MLHPRSLSALSRATLSRTSARAVVLLLIACGAADIGCSAPPGTVTDDDMPAYTGTIPGAGGGSNANNPPLSGTGGVTSGQTNENNPNPVGPIASTGAGGSGSPSPEGAGGSASLPVAGAGGRAAGGTAGGTGAAVGGTGGTATGAAGAGTNTGPGTLPEPPGDAFLFDDFESGAPGTQPAAWDRWINYTTTAGNTLAGQQYALLDTSDKFSGNQSVHFHAEGATQPAMLTMTLPDNLTRIHIRAYVKTSRQIGNQTPDAQSNHETLMGLRATPNDGNFEIRFGGAKGALGYNMVGPGRSDAVSPGQALWGSAPAITTNAWHCVELSFINDNPGSPEAHASVDGQEVRAVTQLGDWHVPLSGEGTTWLNGMFNEVILGWQSFSPQPSNDVWMDDVVLSQSPIGCN
jgi:hypothetical protein